MSIFLTFFNIFYSFFKCFGCWLSAAIFFGGQHLSFVTKFEKFRTQGLFGLENKKGFKFLKWICWQDLTRNVIFWLENVCYYHYYLFIFVDKQNVDKIILSRVIARKNTAEKDNRNLCSNLGTTWNFLEFLKTLWIYKNAQIRLIMLICLISIIMFLQTQDSQKSNILHINFTFSRRILFWSSVFRFPP